MMQSQNRKFEGISMWKERRRPLPLCVTVFVKKENSSVPLKSHLDTSISAFCRACISSDTMTLHWGGNSNWNRRREGPVGWTRIPSGDGDCATKPWNKFWGSCRERCIWLHICAFYRQATAFEKKKLLWATYYTVQLVFLLLWQWYFGAIWAVYVFRVFCGGIDVTNGSSLLKAILYFIWPNRNFKTYLTLLFKTIAVGYKHCFLNLHRYKQDQNLEFCSCTWNLPVCWRPLAHLHRHRLCSN